MRSGAQYLESLRDGRQVVMDGRLVEGVPTHPALAGVCRTVAGLYDRIAAERDALTFEPPGGGGPAFLAHQVPRSAGELRRRRLGLGRVADATYGLIGRGPEHVASFLAGFASAPEVFARKGDRFGENVVRFQARARDEHLYVTYAIIPPQVDRSKTASDQAESHLAAGVLRERDDGIVIRGAQMLGTAAALSDYLFLSCIPPLRPGDEDYAISLVVPTAAPGLRLYARRGYAAGQPSVYDYPLSTRFDETDALAVFRDVFVPWEQVFVYRDVALVRAQFFETPAHVLGNHQAQVRLVSKTRFLLGLAVRIARVNGVEKLPPVQAQLGELASLAAVVEGMVLAAEAAAERNAAGVVLPNPRFLYGAMGLQSQLYPRMVHLLRELAGGGLVQLPSSVHEFANPDTAEDIRRYVQSPGVRAEDRVKLFKLAWEMVGSEFAGRHQQYEMFYAGAPHVARTYAYMNYDFSDALALVDHCLGSYDLDTPHAPAGQGQGGG
jgi:4-hydroxyphenylacetate 3-monooxygenase